MDYRGSVRAVRRRLRHAATAHGFPRQDAVVAAELAVWLGKLDQEVFGHARIPVVFSGRGSFSRRMLACYRSTTGQEAFLVFPEGLSRRSRRMRQAVIVPAGVPAGGGRPPSRWELLASLASHEVRHRYQASAAYLRLFTPGGAPAAPADLVSFIWRQLAVRYPAWARDMTRMQLSRMELEAQLHPGEFDAIVVEHIVLVRVALGHDLSDIVSTITMNAPEVA